MGESLCVCVEMTKWGEPRAGREVGYGFAKQCPDASLLSIGGGNESVAASQCDICEGENFLFLFFFFFFVSIVVEKPYLLLVSLITSRSFSSSSSYLHACISKLCFYLHI